MKKKYLSLGIILFFTFLTSVIGGYVTSNFKEPWYSELNLSSINPPAWVFAPVWTTLYLFMSVAAWRIWIKLNELKILLIYLVHLIFNCLWTIIFFGLHNILLAAIDLAVILMFILILLSKYYKRDKIAFYLIVPYFVWSSYALLLNILILNLN